ncbi:MAG: 4Fe-4S binding protein [Christensenellales bacterium]
MLTKEQIAQAKGRGFLLNRGTELFSGRIVCPGAVYTADEVALISECAQRYGNGKVAFTVRMAAEIPGMAYENLDAAEEFLSSRSQLTFGGTGARVRPIVACKGTTCIYGNADTQALARKIYEDYYIGRRDRKLPHKFKIGIGGCPNGCIKPSLNDFGIEARRVPKLLADKCRACKVCSIVASCQDDAISINSQGQPVFDMKKCITCGVCISRCPFHALEEQTEPLYQITIGGMAGRHLRPGTPLRRLVREDEIAPIIDRTMDWYCEHADGRERLGKVIDRVGVEQMQQAVLPK